MEVSEHHFHSCVSQSNLYLSMGMQIQEGKGLMAAFLDLLMFPLAITIYYKFLMWEMHPPPHKTP